jgi:DNA repair protein RecO (recombination protein O)
MTVLVTDAVVLHIFDYLETSRIVRLATREMGVQSALARGARRSRSRYGSALDLFASGVAELSTKPGRELHTLSSFDVVRARPRLAEDLGRFTGASALAELALRFSGEDTHPELFDTFVEALDALDVAESGTTVDVSLRSAWRIVGELGFGPSLDRCSSCESVVPGDQPASFSHRAGGVICAACARLEPVSRSLPPDARGVLAGWLEGEHGVPLDPGQRRAHQRLLREFLREHLAEGRPLRAFDVWERERWDEPVVAARIPIADARSLDANP